MARKTVSEATKCQITGMKDGSMISYKEIAKRLKISENCVRNTLKIFKTTGGIKHHAESKRLRKKTTERENSLILCQVRANPRLSNRELINMFNKNRE